jgi:hypothetical protein
MSVLDWFRKPLRVIRLAVIQPGKETVRRELETAPELIDPREADPRVVVPEDLPAERADPTVTDARASWDDAPLSPSATELEKEHRGF